MKTPVCLLLFLAVANAPARDWPQFRGPETDGSSDAADVPVAWSENESILWRSEIPGRGWSSPVIMGDDVWLTTAVERTATEAELEVLFADTDPKKRKQLQIAAEIHFRAIHLSLATGEVLDEIDLFTTEAPDPIHGLNSYASPTPFLEEGRLYCDFGTYGTAAIDTTNGEILWTAEHNLVHSVGPGSSPFVVDDLLILVRDGVDAQFVVALDKNDGTEVWRKARPPMDAPDGDRMKAYSTPILIEPDGRRQLVIPTSQWIVSYVPETGDEIWRIYHGTGFSLVPRPVYGNGFVYFCTGFGKPELWAVRPDGEGDVTDTHVAWVETKRISKKPSPILHEGLLFVIQDDGGVVTCLNAVNGEVRWAERLGGNFSASPVLVEGHIYACNEEGETHIFEASETFKPITVNHLEDGIMASPIPLDGGILIRTKTNLVRIGN